MLMGAEACQRTERGPDKRSQECKNDARRSSAHRAPCDRPQAHAAGRRRSLRRLPALRSKVGGALQGWSPPGLADRSSRPHRLPNPTTRARRL